MVKLIARGGFGNQLFQYAAARRLAKSHGVDLVVDTRFYSPLAIGSAKSFVLDHLPIKARVVRYPWTGLARAHAPWRRAYRRIIEENTRTVFREREPGYDERVLNLPANALLDGYFQSYRYLVPRDAEILSEMDLSVFIRPQHEPILRRIRQDAPISVHVRRGDYVGDPGFELSDFESYLSQSLDVMRSKLENPRFLVFSDDLEWCRRHPLFASNCEFFTPPDDLWDGGSLYLMSQCAHHIVANSSFSWWAAWLNWSNDKIVIAPKNWIQGLASNQMQILPPEWIDL